MGTKQRLHGAHVPPDRPRRAGERPVPGEDEAEVPCARLRCALDQWDEVGDVVGDEGALLGDRRREQLVVRHRAQLVSFSRRDDIMASGSKLLRDCRRVVRVEQELHANSA